MIGLEIKYTQVEKMALALVVSARKLHPYFQAHRIIVLSNHPLSQVLQKLETFGKIMKCTVELSEYDI